ncbi:hypothetical protein [Variovorax rhizosphaerae]|uniref:Alpha/beta hydrolase n=1 Tax=Variovorax rhizosphaerae TaxID=1836200 RepID=A0ABU8WPP6_9BURK
MSEKIIIKRPRALPESPKAISPPVIQEPLYQCAVAVTVLAYQPNAEIDLDVAGSITTALGGYPFPNGVTIILPAALVAGQKVRARQRVNSVNSAWTKFIVVGDHTRDYPAGPPRPQINPAPVYECGVRTGVGNLLPGGHVWITADGTKVGEVNGCAAQQGINVVPAYKLNQVVQAWFELCQDPAPPSVGYTTGKPPSPLPAPTLDPVYAGGQSLTIRNIVNGARVTLIRNGASQGTWPCWGGALTINGLALFAAGDTFAAIQEMCRGAPPSPPGSGVVQPCGSLPAPEIGPVQGGDTSITVTQCAPDAIVKVWVNGVPAGASGPPVVNLNTTLLSGDEILVVQDLAGCHSALALKLTVACVDPPVRSNPADLDLFPVGFAEYQQGNLHGIAYYPAKSDGKGTAFHERLAGLGPVPIVFMAHGNHSPADPSYLGYDYFQHDLAKMGVVSVSIDCNALNGAGGGVQNIVDRADLIIDHIALLQSMNADPASTFFKRLDFGRTGLMGHSRGGDAVVMVPPALALPGVTKSVLALAPTNFRYWAGQSTVQPKGYAYLTLLPAGDGDVRDNNGAQFYDIAEPAPFKSQLYVHYTNHNFFNRRWLYDDSLSTPPQPAVNPRAEHERLLSTYGCALARATLLGHAVDGYLSGHVLPAGVLTQNVHKAFQKKAKSVVTVDHFGDGNTIATNSLGQPNTQSGGINAGEFTFDQPPAPGIFNNSFYGLTIGMVLAPKAAGGIFRSALKKPLDLSKREVWLRCAEVTDGQSVAVQPTGFLLGLEDQLGIRAWVDVDAVGGLFRPYPRNPGMIKTMLSTARFRGACFKAKRFDLSTVVAVLLQCDRKRPRAIAFDDIQIY